MRQLVCKIQHRNDDISTNEKTCLILPEKELGCVENEDETGISFGKKRDILNIRNDDILLRLECPICSNFMRTNIKLCTAGHSVCNECEVKLDKCPMCTLPFYGARNFALESVGDLLKGLIRGDKLECPLRKQFTCLWKGNQSDIVEHIRDFHRDKIVINKILTKVLDYCAEFSQIDYLMAYGQVFKIICKKDKCDNLLAVIIELIGHDEDAQRSHIRRSRTISKKQDAKGKHQTTALVSCPGTSMEPVQPVLSEIKEGTTEPLEPQTVAEAGDAAI
ncbi:hypothetical protein Trydic_g14029 [Trypoxylus dichotomus]